MKSELALVRVAPPSTAPTPSNPTSCPSPLHFCDSTAFTGIAQWDQNHDLFLGVLRAGGLLVTYALDTGVGGTGPRLFQSSAFQVCIFYGSHVRPESQWKAVNVQWGNFEFIPGRPNEILFYQVKSSRILFAQLPGGASPTSKTVNGAGKSPPTDTERARVFCVGRHASFILCMSVRMDGMAMASAGTDGSIRVWRLSDGALLCETTVSSAYLGQPFACGPFTGQGPQGNCGFCSGAVQAHWSSSRILGFVGKTLQVGMAGLDGKLRLWAIPGAKCDPDDISSALPLKRSRTLLSSRRTPITAIASHSSKMDCQDASLQSKNEPARDPALALATAMQFPEFMAIGTSNGGLRVWVRYGSSQKWVSAWTGTSGEVSVVCLSFRADGGLLAAGTSILSNQASGGHSQDVGSSEQVFLYETTNWCCVGTLTFKSWLGSCLFYRPPVGSCRNGGDELTAACRILLVCTSDGLQAHILPELSPTDELSKRSGAKTVRWADIKKTVRVGGLGSPESRQQKPQGKPENLDIVMDSIEMRDCQSREGSSAKPPPHELEEPRRLLGGSDKDGSHRNNTDKLKRKSVACQAQIVVGGSAEGLKENFHLHPILTDKKDLEEFPDCGINQKDDEFCQVCWRPMKDQELFRRRGLWTDGRAKSQVRERPFDGFLRKPQAARLEEDLHKSERSNHTERRHSQKQQSSRKKADQKKYPLHALKSHNPSHVSTYARDERNGLAESMNSADQDVLRSYRNSEEEEQSLQYPSQSINSQDLNQISRRVKRDAKKRLADRVMSADQNVLSSYRDENENGDKQIPPRPMTNRDPLNLSSRNVDLVKSADQNVLSSYRNDEEELKDPQTNSVPPRKSQEYSSETSSRITLDDLNRVADLMKSADQNVLRMYRTEEEDEDDQKKSPMKNQDSCPLSRQLVDELNHAKDGTIKTADDCVLSSYRKDAEELETQRTYKLPQVHSQSPSKSSCNVKQNVKSSVADLSVADQDKLTRYRRDEMEICKVCHRVKKKPSAIPNSHKKLDDDKFYFQLWRGSSPDRQFHQTTELQHKHDGLVTHKPKKIQDRQGGVDEGKRSSQPVKGTRYHKQSKRQRRDQGPSRLYGGKGIQEHCQVCGGIIKDDFQLEESKQHAENNESCYLHPITGAVKEDQVIIPVCVDKTAGHTQKVSSWEHEEILGKCEIRYDKRPLPTVQSSYNKDSPAACQNCGGIMPSFYQNAEGNQNENNGITCYLHPSEENVETTWSTKEAEECYLHPDKGSVREITVEQTNTSQICRRSMEQHSSSEQIALCSSNSHKLKDQGSCGKEEGHQTLHPLVKEQKETPIFSPFDGVCYLHPNKSCNQIESISSNDEKQYQNYHSIKEQKDWASPGVEPKKCPVHTAISNIPVPVNSQETCYLHPNVSQTEKEQSAHKGHMGSECLACDHLLQEPQSKEHCIGENSPVHPVHDQESRGQSSYRNEFRHIYAARSHVLRNNVAGRNGDVIKEYIKVHPTMNSKKIGMSSQVAHEREKFQKCIHSLKGHSSVRKASEEVACKRQDFRLSEESPEVCPACRHPTRDHVIEKTPSHNQEHLEIFQVSQHPKKDLHKGQASNGLESHRETLNCKDKLEGSLEVGVCRACKHPMKDHVLRKQSNGTDIGLPSVKEVKYDREDCHIHKISDSSNILSNGCRSHSEDAHLLPTTWLDRATTRAKESSGRWLEKLIATGKIPAHIAQQYFQGKRKWPPQIKKQQCYSCAKKMERMTLFQKVTCPVRYEGSKQPRSSSLKQQPADQKRPRFCTGQNRGKGEENEASRHAMARMLRTLPVLTLSNDRSKGHWSRKENQTYREKRNPCSGRWVSILEEVARNIGEEREKSSTGKSARKTQGCARGFPCSKPHGESFHEAKKLEFPELYSSGRLLAKVQRVHDEMFDNGKALKVATTMGIKLDTNDSIHCERAIHVEKGPTRMDTVPTRNLGRRSTRQMYTDLCKIVEPPDPIRAHATAPRRVSVQMDPEWIALRSNRPSMSDLWVADDCCPERREKSGPKERQPAGKQRPCRVCMTVAGSNRASLASVALYALTATTTTTWARALLHQAITKVIRGSVTFPVTLPGSSLLRRFSSRSKTAATDLLTRSPVNSSTEGDGGSSSGLLGRLWFCKSSGSKSQSAYKNLLHCSVVARCAISGLAHAQLLGPLVVNLPQEGGHETFVNVTLVKSLKLYVIFVSARMCVKH